MRIVAGRYRGQRLTAPKTQTTRPTSDRVREALFNILGSIQDFRVLDLFSGTGAIALEALSRGAQQATCVEKDRKALAALKDNAARLQVGSHLSIVPQDVHRFCRQNPPLLFDLIFADPPWAEAHPFVEAHGKSLSRWLSDSGYLILERDRKDTPPPELVGLKGPDLRTYGDTLLAIYRKNIQ